VEHITGILHVSTGQAIVERAHRTIKEYLAKQKDVDEVDPVVRLNKVLFTLNFMSLAGDAENPPVITH
ncbi:IGEB protein, partial [Edolisoma coerulescens]|nr:IGEB protein [Edolisoma coerulescens]